MGDTVKEVKFSVQMTTGAMFDFLYWHSYHGFYGILNYAFSLAGVAALVAGFGEGNPAVTLMLVALALLFTVINPLILYSKATKQIKRTPMFGKPLLYKFDKDGFSISQDNNTDSAKWDNILLIRETGKNIVLYMGAANAIILPKKDCGDKLPELKELLRAVLPELSKKLK